MDLRAALLVGLGLGAGALALAACSTVGAPPTVPVESVNVAGIDASAGPIAPLPKAAAEDRSRCDMRLALTGRIRTGASCQLDEQVSKSAGRLRYPCNGDGPVDLDVGSHRFTGSLVGGRVQLELTTELDWDDGCHWETHQTVTGALRGSTLRWTYSEKPVRGQNCFASCTATADMKPSAASASVPDDDLDDADP